MRGRGNNNNNRKGPNPLARSYESNGPDVKIRGTAQQVADKYATLARDAQSSGDRVMAENYLQHAEHYNRIIAAAQAQLQQQSPRETRDDFDDDGDERDTVEQSNFNGHKQRQPQSRVEDGSGPQPEIEGVPAELALKGDNPGPASRTEAKSGEANGHVTESADAAGEEDTAKPSAPRRGRRPAAAKAEEAQADDGDDKPARRTRRPRARKTDETEIAAAPTEEAAAQG
ncbi:DUF4167 domain-containing protein [Nitratireductor sp. ZSWI3]|uniref:DUF4167 domain-containing protein n=1 Tax=Nitratireductor sp. ZSWI3 TaxID=2966359 RepID=UPI00214F72E3|nr:DUF4167 domain-containing protein [Nitratireductor sp. ZSWI3]MCR4267942.1 DUF4167 domain-containing protein [Nitratireductor sp. ZSWI3]